MLSHISPKIVGDPVANNRLYDAVNILLSMKVCWQRVRYEHKNYVQPISFSKS